MCVCVHTHIRIYTDIILDASVESLVLTHVTDTDTDTDTGTHVDADADTDT